MFKRVSSYFKSTFVRYIVSYLMLMALLVGGLTIYMYSYYRQSVYESTIATESSASYQQKYRADAKIENLDIFSSYVSRLPLSSVSRALSEYWDEQDGLIFMYFNGTLYSPDAAFSLSQWLNEYDFEDLTAEQVQSNLIQNADFNIVKAQTIRSFFGEQRLMSASFPAGGGYTLIVMLNENSLLSVSSQGESSANRYMIYKTEICARSESFDINERKVLEAGLFVSEEMSEVIRLQGVDYLFCAVPGENSDIAYVSVQPLTGIRQKAAGVWLGFMAVLLALAIPTTVFMVFISRKNLAPILEMGRHFQNSDDKYSDTISDIVSGIERLEDKNREIQTDSLSARRHMFARNLVTGVYEDFTQAREAGAEVDIDIQKRFYAVMLIGAPKERRTFEYPDALISLAPQSVTCVGTELMENSQSMLLCFADEGSDIEAFAQALSEEKMILALHLPVAISAMHGDIKEMSIAYLEATSAYESRFFMGENRLLKFSEIPFAAKAPGLSDEDAMDIKRALKDGDREMLDKCLERLRTTLSSQGMNLFGFRKLYNDVISVIMSEAQDEQYSNADIYDLFSLSGCRSVDELEQVLRSVCENIIASKSSEDRLPLMQKVISIMTVNYTDSEFTLTRAAELAGITPARLSSEFKTKMGMTPMDYLTMLRMEAAKKLLIQSDLPVSDVCRQAGYSDASSFTRRFKQYTGITPLQYRQNAKADGSENA